LEAVEAVNIPSGEQDSLKALLSLLDASLPRQEV
jgi:hypothetical protein